MNPTRADFDRAVLEIAVELGLLPVASKDAEFLPGSEPILAFAELVGRKLWPERATIVDVLCQEIEQAQCTCVSKPCDICLDPSLECVGGGAADDEVARRLPACDPPEALPEGFPRECEFGRID